MLLQKTYSVDYAHRLMNHKGLCKNLHGHTGVVEVFLSGEVQDNGMIVDFGELLWLRNIVCRLDHAVILQREDPLLTILRSHEETNSFRVVGFCQGPPTAENIVLYLKEEINLFIKEKVLVDLTLEKIRFAETPGNVVEG